MGFIGLIAPFYANPALVAAELAHAASLGLDVFALGPVVGEDALDQYKTACGIKEGASWKKDALANARERLARGVRGFQDWEQFAATLAAQGSSPFDNLFSTPPIDPKKLLSDAVSDKQQDARIHQLILTKYPGVFEALIEAAVADSGRFLPLMGKLVPGFPPAEKGFAELFRHHPLSTFAYLQQNLPVKILLGKYFLANVDTTTLIERIESDKKVIDCLIVLSILAAEGNTKAAEYAKNYDLDRLRETATPEREVRLLKHLAAAGNPKALEQMRDFDVKKLDGKHQDYKSNLYRLYWDAGNEGARQAMRRYLSDNLFRDRCKSKAESYLSCSDPALLTRAINILIDIVGTNDPKDAIGGFDRLQEWFAKTGAKTEDWKVQHARMEAIAKADFSAWMDHWTMEILPSAEFLGRISYEIEEGYRSRSRLAKRMAKLLFDLSDKNAGAANVFKNWRDQGSPEAWRLQPAAERGPRSFTPPSVSPRRDDPFADAPSQLAGESSIAVALGVPPETPQLPQEVLWYPSPSNFFRTEKGAWHFYFPRDREALTFGRGTEVDIRFEPYSYKRREAEAEVAKISRSHFRIRRLEGDNFIITILGETNDVILNHSPEVLSPGKDHWIREGDIISIGKVEFVFHAKPKDIGR